MCGKMMLKSSTLDIDSEEELKDTTVQDPSSAEENDIDKCLHLPSDKADVHQFVENKVG
jgi:hypothetical protein